MDLVAAFKPMRESDLDEVIADLVGRGSVQEPDRRHVGVVGLLHHPRCPPSIMLGQVCDQPPKTVGVGQPVLVLYTDRDLVASLVKSGGEDVQPLAEDVRFSLDGREILQLKCRTQNRHALGALRPRREVAGLSTEDLPGAEPLHSSDRGDPRRIRHGVIQPSFIGRNHC